MHWMDRAAAAALRRLAAHRRVFREGWGDRDRIDAYLGRVRTLPPIADPPILERPARRSGHFVIRDISFESPAEDLPPASRSARARVISSDEDPERIVVLLSQWNDHDYRARHRLARLLLDRGIAAVIPEHPYYGDRRPVAGVEQPIATVADFGPMGRAAVLEGRVLARHFHRAGYRVGVSGYSMGGNLAAFVGATVPFPVATAPLAGAHSPAPAFLDGVLRVSIDWDALGGDNPETDARLREYLGSATILDHPPPSHLRTAVLVAGTKDGFIPTAAVHAVHRHWPGSRLDWVNAGHGSMLWHRKDRLVGGIVDSFDRLEALEGVGEGGTGHAEA
jgi:hypothetical protein